MDRASSDKAVFVTTVTPVGLTPSPSAFEQLIELILAGLRFKTCFIYLIHIIVDMETSS